VKLIYCSRKNFMKILYVILTFEYNITYIFLIMDFIAFILHKCMSF